MFCVPQIGWAQNGTQSDSDFVAKNLDAIVMITFYIYAMCLTIYESSSCMVKEF